MRRRQARAGSDRGAATVLVVAAAGLVLLIGAALSVAASIYVAHRTAQAAADLAVLAGAQRLADGGEACSAAADVASANGAVLASCTVEGRDVRVSVSVAGPDWLVGRRDLTADARAGPAG